MTFEMIKRNYDRGLWNAAMVGMAVKKNVIAAAQYMEITGEEYTGGLSLQEQLAEAEAVAAILTGGEA